MSSKSKRRPQPDPDETAYQAFQDQLAAATDDLERSTVLGYTLGHAAGYY
ncbi:hypothetical protein [Mycobacterium sp.]|nr:hypothetical protein [Mycobacterium sp.]HTY31004.1 hypothetical protein [Mycobacterium sp.]